MKQELTFTIYPTFNPSNEPQQWHLTAEVFGIWAVHKPHPDELPHPDVRWCISHAPSGAVAFVAKKKNVAIRAAKVLAELDSPTVELVPGDSACPDVVPLSAEWIGLVAKKLKGIDVLAWVGRFVHPEELPEHVAKVRAQ